MNRNSKGSSWDVPDLIPARMLNEFAYCPRLCYIEWIQGEFLDNADTVDGRFQHRRVDVNPRRTSEREFEILHSRSVSLAGPEVGITCKIDLLEGQGINVTPVDYKRGVAPDIPEGAYEPERVQLCAQGLVLKENGFQCNGGAVYFIQSKKRVTIPFTEALVDRTKELIANLKIIAKKEEMPLPLEDSPKCIRCSLAGICLPDEVNLMREMEAEGIYEKSPRKLIPTRDDQIPVYVVGQGQTIRKKGDCIEIWSNEGKVMEIKTMEISQLSLYGNVEITTPAMVELLQKSVPVIHYTHGGWFQGICMGTTHKNVELRIHQYQWSLNHKRAITIARAIVSGKIRNCRTLIRRNDKGRPKDLLDKLSALAKAAGNAQSAESLLGIEGSAAEVYFSRFGSLLKTKGFSFENRNRRPPKDPVNAVLSYLYGILVKDLFVTLLAVGFDPYLGFYHRPRYGRPSLALDLMEEFRPIIADSVAITLFNNKELPEADFIHSNLGVSLTPDGKKSVIGGYEHRMETEVTHPLFGYRVSYRRIIEVQARLLAWVLSGEIKEYLAFTTR